MAAAAFGEGVGSQPKPVVEPVGDVRELSRFSFRVTTPAVSARQDPDGWSDLKIEGFGTSERRPGAPNLPSRTFLVAIPDGAVPRLEVEPLGVRVLPGKRPRPVARVEASVEPEDEHGRRRISRQRTFQAEDTLYAAPEAAVRLGQVGVLRDQRYVEVIVTPARYRADRGGIEVWDRFQVTVAFEGSGTTAAQPTPNPRYEDVYRKAFVNYSQGLLFRLPSIESTTFSTSPVAPAAVLAGPRYEIKVRQTGVVRLDSVRLTGTGFPAEPISTWRLRSRGVEVPLQVNDDGDGVLEAGEWVQFWGQALDEEPKTTLDTDVPGNVDLWAYSDATDENVYLLTAEPGPHARMTTRASAPTFTRTPPTDFEAVAHREVDDAWRPLGSADPWDWSPTLQTGTATTLRTDDVALPGLVSATAPIDVKVEMKATSEDGTVLPDHRTRLTLLNSGNTQLAQQDDDGSFDGRVVYEQSLAWAGGQVTNPMRIRTEARPISQGNHSIMLNWIEVRYRRTFTAASDGLVFTWPNQDAEFVVGNLLSSGTALAVYEVTGTANTIAQPVQLTGVSVSGAGPFSARFRVDKNLGLPDGAPRTFVVAGNGAAAVPAGADFASDTVSELRDNAIQADLVVIAHPSLLDQAAGSPLTQLLSLRASRGISSKVARLDDIQDEFNDGIAGPAAIKNFLRWVMSTAPGEGWASPKPAYVLLLGDGSYDYKAGTVNGNYVPTQIIFKDDPALGYYASDNVLAAVVGNDALPDLTVGRLPARSLSEANALLQKVLDYEQIAPAGSWRAHALFVSDRGKPITNTNEALEFENTNALAQAEMKIPPHTARQLRYFTDYGGTNSALIRNDIKKGINGTLDAGVDGAAVVQFIGHGNFDLWSDDIIFDKNDAAALTNGGRLPWLLAHNCLTSGFHSTALTTIGEAFLKRVGGGSIAVFSPSGLSFSYFGDIIAHTVFHDLYGPPKARDIATPVMDSLVALLANQSVEPLEGYVLLGDPALRLVLPTMQPPGIPTATPSSRRVDLSWTPSASAGATYDVWRTADLVNDPYVKLNGAPLAGTTFADTTPSNGTTYFYYVVARDTPGFESRWSNFNSDCLVSGPDCVDARPLNPNPPATPGGVSVVDPESGGRLNLSWLPISDPNNELVRYDVCWGTVSGSYTCASAAKNTTFVLTNLTNGIRYYVVVRATNTSSLTSQSVEVSAVPTFVRGVKSPAFISSLRVNRSGNDLVLTWNPVTTDIYGKPLGTVTYQVFRGTTAGFDPSLGPPLATNLSTATFTDSGAAVAGPAYYYLVRARDGQGNVGGLGR
ncbi:MAG TPA: C25 family cysteine peptidase, partial [Candidatus Polarisedimenticolaceae bacterium]|nr:C25 family cysteine peptidase [Candidatus Polarisedimenticolaceae bacterium]